VRVNHHIIVAFRSAKVAFFRGAKADTRAFFICLLLIIPQLLTAAESDESRLPTMHGQSQRFTASLKLQLDRLDPQADGWQTEEFSEQTMATLKSLGKLMGRDLKNDLSTVAKLVASDFQCVALTPENTPVVFEDGVCTVRRASTSPLKNEPTTKEPATSGPKRFATAAAQLLESLSHPSDVHVHFKMVHVEQTATIARTKCYFQLGGQTQAESLQVNTKWDCLWDVTSSSEPKLKSITLVDEFEEVRCKKSDQGKRFVDRTVAVLGKNPSFAPQFLRGLDHWAATLDRRLGLDIVGTHGMAVGDVDGDGLDDVLLCEPGGLPNRLFLHKADGTARDISRVSGVDFLESTRSALFLDFDNDGDQDLALAAEQFVVLMSNDGYGRFSQRAGFRSTSLNVSLAAADFDNDSDLDIYVCGYFTKEDAEKGSIGLASPVPFHDANNGGRNMFLRNDGNWRFTNATKEVGLNVANTRFSLAAAWEDYDLDGDPDLYVANDYGRNCLYRNDGGVFKNVAAEAGVEDMASGMSASWGDFNRDGLPDLYVSNMFSSAGNRISYQRQFLEEANKDIRTRYRRFARGNTLFQNQGDGTFRDVTMEANVSMGRWAWCSNFVDLNNDGWEDLVIANGMLSRDRDTGDL